MEDTEIAAGLRAVISRLVRQLRKETDSASNLSLTERMILRALDGHAHLLPSELSAMEKVSSQAMSQILSHLSALGYIQRTPSEADRRKTHISITDQGRAFVHQNRSEKEVWLAKAVRETLTAEEKQALEKALPILLRLADYKS